jgi:hypothetical protein
MDDLRSRVASLFRGPCPLFRVTDSGNPVALIQRYLVGMPPSNSNVQSLSFNRSCDHLSKQSSESIKYCISTGISVAI